MKADRYKHTRMRADPQEKYKIPMTFNQSVGFYNSDKLSRDIAKQPQYPNRKCAETKYAEEMIKTGIHFAWFASRITLFPNNLHLKVLQYALIFLFVILITLFVYLYSID